MEDIKAVEVVQYRTIRVHFDFEERVDGVSITTHNETAIHSEYDSVETLDKVTKLLKSLIRKDKNRLLITIEGQDHNYQCYGIKRYSFNIWGMDNEFNIEHRPYTVENSYAVDNVSKYDSMYKMVKAFGIDFMGNVLAHIENLKVKEN